MLLASPEFNLTLPPGYVHLPVALNPDQVMVAYASDLHLDFANINDEFFDPPAHVLILAGDIIEIDRCKKHIEFFRRCSENFEHVLVISGNHEYYGSAIPKADDEYRDFLQSWDNIHYLQNEVFVHRGVTFVGCTLWTDLDRGNPIAINAADALLNDFKQIRMNHKDYRRFKPQDSIDLHKRSLDFIRHAYNNAPGEVVVITHHAPTHKSIHPRFAAYTYDNFCYYSNLSEFILDREHIKFWVHGHVHNLFDYEVGTCRVLCNPRGYPGERPDRLEAFRPRPFALEAA